MKWVLCFMLAVGSAFLYGQTDSMYAMRREAQNLQKREHYAEALQKYQELIKAPEVERELLWNDFSAAQLCLAHLQRTSEIDALLAEVAACFPEDWWLHWQIGSYALSMPDYGVLHDGKFYRGTHRVTGTHLQVRERNRRESLLHLEKARKLLQTQTATDQDRTYFLLGYAAAFLHRSHWELLQETVLHDLPGSAWRLQTLSDLEQLPGWESAANADIRISGAPVDGKGNPIFYQVPASFELAANDGERFRWLLQQAGRSHADGLRRAELMLANFSHALFGVQTLQQRGWYWNRGGEDPLERNNSLLMLESLNDDESIAQLANGQKRFQLPEDYSFIKKYQALAEQPEVYIRKIIFPRLATLYENRRHPEKALEWWRRYREIKSAEADRRIEQITGNLGCFLPVKAQVFGKPLCVEFQFRNASRVNLKLYRLDMPGILQECQKRILKGDRTNLNYHFSNLGSWLLDANGSSYIKEKVREWELPLEPLPDYRDRITTLEVAVSSPGAYWLVAELPGGQFSRIPLLAEQYQLLMKPLQDELLWQLVQTGNGEPVPEVSVELFAWRQNWNNKSKKSVLISRNLNIRTDSMGCFYVDKKDFPGEKIYSWQWLASAQVQNGQPAFVCSSVHGSFYPGGTQAVPQMRVMVITDRPIYRPGQTVHYKAWMKRPDYAGDCNPVVGFSAAVWLRNPAGELQTLAGTGELEESLPGKVFDAFGGISGEYQIPADAKLGVYRLGVGNSPVSPVWNQEITFRVEEYRKPEFEVTLEMPAEPPALGSAFNVKVQAKYYFGTPVASGKAAIKVLRYEHTLDFWPVSRWDWLYGKGYWWLGEDYPWYPGWQQWVCPPPIWHWLPPRQERPPEVVAQLEQALDANGEILVNVDSSLVKELYGDRDHRYEITAEVTDLSRRSIIGKGTVLVGRRPYILRCWTQGGYYNAGQTLTASAQLSAVDGKPAAGKGTLKLFRIRYNALNLPEERLLEQLEVVSGEQGLVSQKFIARESGQYRLAWSMTPEARPSETISGSSLICVYGKGRDEGDFRYNTLELIPDKSEYAPGETMRLRINSDQAGSLVLLFIRPENGLCQRPQFVRLTGKSREIEIPVSASDTPNFYLEAALFSQGELHQAMRSIAVPPESKVLDLQVEPEQSDLQPGEEARIALRLRDLSGRPFHGSVVVAVYDKSIEYFTGGSNVPGILPHFWSWKRHHHPNWQMMQWYLNNSLKDKEKQLLPIGLFASEMLLAAGTKGEMVRFKADGAAGGMLRAAAAPAMLGADMVAESANAEEATPLAETAVRRNFADTAFWIADLETDAEGRAKVAFPMPDSLTTWKVRVWAMGKQCQVAEAERELVTAKKLLVRLQAPRFFVEKDEVVLSAVIHHQLLKAVDVHTLLELEGGCLELMPGEQAAGRIEIAASGEARVDWRVKVIKSGEALIRMKALSVQASDAMEQRFPVKVHGMNQLQPFCGVIRPEQTAGKFVFDLPQQIQPGTARLQLSWSPSLALAMLDALPYLLEYPYGCTEQTLNRFLPAVLTRATLQKLGYSLQDLQQKKVNLNPQELGDPEERAKRNFSRSDEQSPVFSDAEMDKIIAQGLADLAAMRCADGGWGWFSGWGENSLPHLTAQIVHGLLLARKCGVEVPSDLLQSGVNWLLQHQRRELSRLQKKPGDEDYKSHADHLDALVFKVLCETQPANFSEAMSEFLFRDKELLTPYSKALVACGEWEALRASGTTSVSPGSKLSELLRNLRQFVEQDDENQTAWLAINPGWRWYWYGDENETQAIFLQLLTETGEGKGELASRLVKYLLNNRQHGTYWRSTRDTAAVLEAFCAYLANSGELDSQLEFEILLDGRKIKGGALQRENFFSANNRLILEEPDLPKGKHEVEFRKTGSGPLYFNGYLEYFSREDFLRKAGLEVRIDRVVYRLHRDDEKIQLPDQKGQVAGTQTENYRREKLATGAIINSGDLLEVELLIESKNDYEYLLIEDFRAAACETVDNQSGYTRNALNAYVEFRDDRTAFFVRSLPRGKHSMKYHMKTETPGKFSALPARICGFYAPELQGNSDEWKTVIEK